MGWEETTYGTGEVIFSKLPTKMGTYSSFSSLS